MKTTDARNPYDICSRADRRVFGFAGALMVVGLVQASAGKHFLVY